MRLTIEYILSLNYFDPQQASILSEVDESQLTAMIQGLPSLIKARFTPDAVVNGVICGVDFDAIVEVIDELEVRSDVILALNWNANKLWQFHEELGLCSFHYARILEQNQGKQRIQLISPLYNLFKVLYLKPKAIQTILSAKTARGMVYEILHQAAHPKFAERKINVHFKSKEWLEKYINVVLTLELTEEMLKTMNNDLDLVGSLNTQLKLSASSIHFLCLYASVEKIAAIKLSFDLLKELMLSEQELMVLFASKETVELLYLCHKLISLNVPIGTVRLFFRQTEPVDEVLNTAHFLLETKKFPKEAFEILNGNACRLYYFSFWFSLKNVHLMQMLVGADAELKLTFLDIYFDLFICLPISMKNIMIIYSQKNWQHIIQLLYDHVETLKLFDESQIMSLICAPELDKTLGALKEALPRYLKNSFSTDLMIELITNDFILAPKCISSAMISIANCKNKKSVNTSLAEDAIDIRPFLQSSAPDKTDEKHSPLFFSSWRPHSPALTETSSPKTEVEEFSVDEGVFFNLC
jgi:hypothetical protein